MLVDLIGSANCEIKFQIVVISISEKFYNCRMDNIQRYFFVLDIQIELHISKHPMDMLSILSSLELQGHSWLSTTIFQGIPIQALLAISNVIIVCPTNVRVVLFKWRRQILCCSVVTRTGFRSSDKKVYASLCLYLTHKGFAFLKTLHRQLVLVPNDRGESRLSRGNGETRCRGRYCMTALCSKRAVSHQSIFCRSERHYADGNSSCTVYPHHLAERLISAVVHLRRWNVVLLWSHRARGLHIPHWCTDGCGNVDDPCAVSSRHLWPHRLCVCWSRSVSDHLLRHETLWAAEVSRRSGHDVRDRWSCQPCHRCMWIRFVWNKRLGGSHGEQPLHILTIQSENVEVSRILELHISTTVLMWPEQLTY